jgi:glutamate-1-semialdehyde 2,1-aminomutase/spore coat polysaccharide biosynthesis protein SpsF
VSALLPNILGYRDPDVDAAIRRQLSAGISFSLSTELEAELAETLCRLIPCAEAVRFGKSGTDATTAAVRLARAFTGRDLVVVGGYHGWADWSMAVGERNLGIPAGVKACSVKMPEKGTMKWGDPFNIPAAIIVEPEGDPDLLRWLRSLCDHHGIVLIFDEVITGFRFDLGGAQKLWGVTPDLACFGKAMANGMPLSAVVGRRDIMKLMEPPENIFYSGTFFGETLSLAASIATIKVLERDDVITRLWDVGLGLSDRVETMIANHKLDEFVSLSGQAPFRRVKFVNDGLAALFRKEMAASGTLIVASHNICAAHGPNEIKRVRMSYDHALGVIHDALAKGDIEERLAGATVAPMVRTA